jgi:large subunit ribosomal protein L29
MKENADKHRALDTAELQKNFRESAEQMFRLKFQMSMGQMEGLKKYRSLRKDRARMLTVLRQRELEPEAAASKQAEEPKAAKKTVAPKKAEAAKAKAAKPKAGKAPAEKAPAKKTPAKKGSAKGAVAKKASAKKTTKASK